MNAKWQMLSVGLLAGLTVFTVTTHAKADPVGNPGDFDFIIAPYGSAGGNESVFCFRFGDSPPNPADFDYHCMMLHDFTYSYYFYAEVDGDGYAHDFGSSFPVGQFVDKSNGNKPITAQLEFRSSSEGVIDVPSKTFNFNDLIARIRFTYDGSAPCTTSNFTMPMSTGHWAGNSGQVCSTGYDKTTGEFCVSGAGWTIPQLPATACNNHGNDINTELHLGLSTGTYAQILGALTDPIMVD